MDRRRTRWLGNAASGFTAVGALVMLAALPASAQVPNPIGEITEEVDTVVTQIGDGVADAAEGATDKAGDAVGGDAGQTTKDAGEAIGGLIRDSSSEAGDGVRETGAALDAAVSDPGGQAPNPDPPGAGGDASVDVGEPTGRGRFSDPGSSGTGAEVSAFDAAPGADGPASVTGSLDDNETVANRRETGNSIEDAVQGITFPLALIALAAAFLAVQGRVDRADPKLSIAILDPDDEMLSFR